MDKNQSLVSPPQFSFPFNPYDIQKKFMASLFLALEEKKLAIFESPTGTVKQAVQYSKFVKKDLCVISVILYRILKFYHVNC